PMCVFLGIHMDTVYGLDHPFQTVEHIDGNTFRGPGVADAKGGLCVMLIALEALERSDFADQVGWEVLINSDEEIGSPGSAPVLAIVRFNLRVPSAELQQRAEAEVLRIAQQTDQRDGISVQLEGGITSPPKLMDDRTRQLLATIEAAGRDLGLTLSTRPSGGV